MPLLNIYAIFFQTYSHLAQTQIEIFIPTLNSNATLLDFGWALRKRWAFQTKTITDKSFEPNSYNECLLITCSGRWSRYRRIGDTIRSLRQRGCGGYHGYFYSIRPIQSV